MFEAGMPLYWPGAIRLHDVVPHRIPRFSIGLASYLAVLEALWLWTGREVFINLFNYWLKIFAVAFGMGVVSGIVMSYQLAPTGRRFPTRPAGDRPLMAYEVLTAFFSRRAFSA